MSMKNSMDTIGSRTRDLPVCGAVPQPTAPPRALNFNNIHCKTLLKIFFDIAEVSPVADEVADINYGFVLFVNIL
jgi:hypothetical protein